LAWPATICLCSYLFSIRLSRKVTIDVFAVQETHKRDHVRSYYQTQTVVTYSDSVITLPTAQPFYTLYLAETPCLFNPFYGMSDSPVCLILRLRFLSAAVSKSLRKLFLNSTFKVSL